MTEQMETIFKPKPHLSEVVSYRDGVVNISAKLDRLKDDFLTEASARPNVDIKEAEAIADKLKTFFDNKELNTHIAEDMKRKGLESPLWRIMAPIGKVAVPLVEMLQMGDLLGSTYSVEAAPALYLNPNKMVAYAGVPENASNERAEAAIIQGVHNTWRHEREHLIRMLDPEAKAEDQRTRNLRIATVLTTSGLIAFGSIYFEPDIPPGGGPRLEAYNAIRLITTAALQIQAPQLVANGLWYTLWNKAEKAADLQGKTGQNLPNLFDFQFEKQK